jgi:hypothetical protein
MPAWKGAKCLSSYVLIARVSYGPYFVYEGRMGRVPPSLQIYGPGLSYGQGEKHPSNILSIDLRPQAGADEGKAQGKMVYDLQRGNSLVAVVGDVDPEVDSISL